MDEGMLARHVRKATKEYALRRELIQTAVGQEFGDWLRTVPSVAGLVLGYGSIRTERIPAGLSRLADCFRLG